MEVILAGYNVDAEVIEAVKNGKQVGPEQFSPEIVPASYARISRDPDPIPRIREKAREDVEGARKSNKNIVFAMGHKSVGNHVNFNIDIMGLSRLAIEALERRRLGCGYTEKSQRYITLDGDYVTPAEFSPEDAERFVHLVENVQNRFYDETFEELVRFHFARVGEEYVPPEGRKSGLAKTIEGWGKEDARYALGLATEAQVGTTFSATTLEHAIRTMKYSDLAEERELAGKLFDVVKGVAPSLILYTDPEIFQKSFPGRELEDANFRDSPTHIRKVVSKTIEKVTPKLQRFNAATFMSDDDVTLVRCNDIDTNVVAALVHQNSLLDIQESYRVATYLNSHADEGMAFMKSVWQNVSAFDNPVRAFEHGGGLTYAMDISSSCYAQLKRHRIMTLTEQEYNPDLGFTVPDSIRKTGFETMFSEVVAQSSALFHEFKPKYGKAAEYCLTNAHKRRVLVTINPRENNHQARQRCDAHAQWDIRDKSHKMVALARQIAPLSHLLCCGKDEYAALRDEVYRKE